MNKCIVFLFSLFVLVSITGCSSDDEQNNNQSKIQGIWKLSAWNVEDGFDMNFDSVVSTNLLNEIDCTQNETLLFDANGIVSSNNTFNPDLEIVLINEATQEYSFSIECDIEGVIGFATLYSVKGNNVLFGENNAILDGNHISILFENSIEIWNNDLTQIVDTKDLTTVYIKQ